MNVIKWSTLKEYGERYGTDAAQQLRAWYQEAKVARWSRPQDIRDRFPTASFVGEETVIFNICGGRYRLIIKVWYPGFEVYVKFFGTHEEYDQVRADEL